MEFAVGNTISIEQMYETVKAAFPQYTISLKRNRLLHFSYIEVRKNALIGSWIRLTDNNASLVGTVPSRVVRALYGGLLLVAFLSGKLKKLNHEIGGYLQAQYA